MDLLREVKVYLNCKKMLNQHARIVYKSKYCKKGEYKQCKNHLVVRFYMDFNQDGNVEMFEKIVYQPDVHPKVDNNFYYHYDRSYYEPDDYNETPYQHFQRLWMYKNKD